MKSNWKCANDFSLIVAFIFVLMSAPSLQASNFNQFFPSGGTSGTMTGASGATTCNASSHNQMRTNSTNHQLEYCHPTTSTWTPVQINSVASVQFTLPTMGLVNPNTLITTTAVGTVGSGTGAITITGDGNPQLSISGGAWASSGAITAGQTLAVRMTSSSSLSTTTSATITVGGVTTVWSLTTVACVAGSTTLAYTGSIVNFTQPEGCNTLTIEAWGAKGGYAVNYTAENGGFGAYIKGTFTTTPGTVYKALVGQKGGISTYNGGGGGGSFVTTSANAAVIIAGGGGGSALGTPGQAGLITTTGGAGSSSGGTGGSGGTAAGGSHGGAGLTGNGATSSCVTAGVAPKSFTNGGTGGTGGTCAAGGGLGGFGGGSGGEHCCQGAGGAGGGYSGGGGANASVSGGAGGSFVSGTNQVTTSGVDAGQSGNGKIIFTYAQ